MTVMMNIKTVTVIMIITQERKNLRIKQTMTLVISYEKEETKIFKSNENPKLIMVNLLSFWLFDLIILIFIK